MFELTERGESQMAYLERRVFEDVEGKLSISKRRMDWMHDFLTALWNVKDTGEAWSPRSPYVNMESFLRREGYVVEV